MPPPPFKATGSDRIQCGISAPEGKFVMRMISKLEAYLEDIDAWIGANMLAPNQEKTKLIIFKLKVSDKIQLQAGIKTAM